MSIKSTKTITRNVAYDKFVKDGKEDGRPHHFNGYDGNTELETEDYYIYYHNQNYKRG